MPSYSPGRPPNERDTLHLLNGTLVYLGVLTSTGAAVNNATTAVPFNQTPASTSNLTGTLAGRVLAVQASAAGFFLPATYSSMASGVSIVATQSTVPPANATIPGLSILTSDVKVFIMTPQHGWLQWISSTGTAHAFVYEVV